MLVSYGYGSRIGWVEMAEFWGIWEIILLHQATLFFEGVYGEVAMSVFLLLTAA